MGLLTRKTDSNPLSNHLVNYSLAVNINGYPCIVDRIIAHCDIVAFELQNKLCAVKCAEKVLQPDGGKTGRGF